MVSFAYLEASYMLAVRYTSISGYKLSIKSLGQWYFPNH